MPRKQYTANQSTALVMVDGEPCLAMERQRYDSVISKDYGMI